VILAICSTRESLLAVILWCMRGRCFALELLDVPQKVVETQESIGRLWRVKPKRDVNGLGGRLKP
jgi:hypothetical protein